jgi:hypothetical protein
MRVIFEIQNVNTNLNTDHVYILKCHLIELRWSFVTCSWSCSARLLELFVC